MRMSVSRRNQMEDCSRKMIVLGKKITYRCHGMSGAGRTSMNEMI